MDAHSLGERKQNKLTANYLLVNEAISLSVKKKGKKKMMLDRLLEKRMLKSQHCYTKNNNRVQNHVAKILPD